MPKMPFEFIRSILISLLSFFLFRTRVASTEIAELRRDLFGEARLSQDFIVLIICSGLIATFGLLSNSAAVIIGAMIIAPLMLPIRALSFGILEGDLALCQRSLRSIIVGSLLIIGLAWFVTACLGLNEFGSEIMARTRPNLLDLGVALAAGTISAYAKLQPKVGDVLAGTAIAVALAPPLCVVGIGIPFGWQWQDWSLTQGANLLFFTNWVGITLACMIVFILRGYSVAHTAQSRRALGLTFGITGLLMIPLGFSLREFLRDADLTSVIRTILVRQTVTVGQQSELERVEINWDTSLPELQLYVQSSELPTPKQVRLLEDFLAEQLGRQFKIIFYVTERRQVESGDDWQE